MLKLFNNILCYTGEITMDKNVTTAWVQPHHLTVRKVLAPLIIAYTRLKYGIKGEPFKEQGDRQYIILFNHQTAFDQFFPYMSFNGAIYFLASEDLFSKGWISSIIRWAAGPIPIKKQTTDLGAIRNCIKVAKEGGTIAIAPEGNRTYSGKTVYMSPGIATLARKLKLPIALYRIEGGYGVHPRWSDCVRKGKMRSYVSRVIEPEEYENMTTEELFAVIQQGLHVDEGVADGIFKSNKRAEYLERAIYVCPYCGLSVFESHGNETECQSCHRKINYGEDKKLRGVGFDFPFEFMTQWSDYQNDFVNSLDVTTYTDKPMFVDKAAFSEVIVYKNKEKICSDAEIKLYGDRIAINENKDNACIFPFSEVEAISVLGKNKLNIYYQNKVYQLKGDKRFNALKYVNICFRYKNISRGNSDGKFLGL